MYIDIMAHPDWVLKHKKKGTLIMKRDDRYYLYMVSSHRNREKKRSQLRTDEYLERITPGGLVEPKAKRILKRYDQVTVKEYGSSFLINHVSRDILDELKKRLPVEGDLRFRLHEAAAPVSHEEC
jgi:hypothetical protein